MMSRSTPLSRLLDGDEPDKPRVTPLDVFKLARKKWLAGERIDVGRIASELGIGRATVFRWVGSRENLYGEVISSGFGKDLERATAAAHDQPGSERLFVALEKLLRALAGSAPLKRFIAEDAEFALRVLTSRHSPVQTRCVEAFREAIDREVTAGTLTPQLPTSELAYLLVRIVESFLYRDVITGDEATADVATALTAIRILCSAPPR